MLLWCFVASAAVATALSNASQHSGLPGQDAGCTASESETGLVTLLQLPLSKRGETSAAALALGRPLAGNLLTSQPSDVAAEFWSVPATELFRGVRLLYLRLELSQELKALAQLLPLFGQPVPAAFGGVALDESGSAQVIVAYFPDAKIAWAGVPGESEPVNVPHHLLSVQLPVAYNGRKMYQTVYALADDDIAELLLRTGSGVPAKLASFAFPAENASAEPVRVKVTRRGQEIFSAAGPRTAPPPGAAAEPFDRPALEWTLFGNYRSAGVHTASFLQRTTRATVQRAWRVGAELRVTEDANEGLRMIFGSLAPLEAWWLEAQLEVTSAPLELPASCVACGCGAGPAGSTAGPAPRGAAPRAVAPRGPQDIVAPWRWGGARLTTASGRGPLPKMAYMSGETLWVSLRIRPEKLQPYLPPGFVLAGDEALIFSTHWKPAKIFTQWGMQTVALDLPLEYSEVLVSIPVQYNGRTFSYLAMLLEDDDVATVAGIDVYGFQKKRAKIHFEYPNKWVPGAGVRLGVRRRGREVLTICGVVGGRTKAPVKRLNNGAPPTIFYQWQQFPRSPTEQRLMFWSVALVARTYVQRELRNIRVSLSTQPQEPLGEWFAGRALRGGVMTLDVDQVPDPLAEEFLFEQHPPSEFAAWWRRTYQALYM